MNYSQSENDLLTDSNHVRHISSDSNLDECIICFNRIEENDNVYVYQCCKQEIHLNCYLQWLNNNLSKTKEIAKLNCIFCRTTLNNKKDIDVIINISTNQETPPTQYNIIQAVPRDNNNRIVGILKNVSLVVCSLYGITTIFYFVVSAILFANSSEDTTSMNPPSPIPP